jgi:hypothetical protein
MSEPEPKFRFRVQKKKDLNRTEPNFPNTTGDHPSMKILIDDFQ